MLYYIDCALGKLIPEIIDCLSLQSNQVELSEITDGTNIFTNASLMREHYNDSKMCGPPQRLSDYLNYKYDEIPQDGHFPSGTEIQFLCIESITGERKTWKIVCDDGVWIGRSTECGIITFFSFFAFVNDFN